MTHVISVNLHSTPLLYKVEHDAQQALVTHRSHENLLTQD